MNKGSKSSIKGGNTGPARLIRIMCWICCSFCTPGTIAQPVAEPPRQSGTSAMPGVQNPSIWLHRAENQLLYAENRLDAGLDTGFLANEFPRLNKDIQLTLNDFNSHGHHMRIRDLEDLRSKLLQQRKQLEKWRGDVRKLNDSVSLNYMAVASLAEDSIHLNIRRDTALWEVYQSEFKTTDSLLEIMQQRYAESLGRTVAIENLVSRSIYNVNHFIISVERELKQRNAALFKRTHPPLWKLGSDSYPSGIGTVFVKTLKQNLASLEFYGKNAYIRAILFRIILLLITLLPVWYFRKNKDKINDSKQAGPFRFVHKYTAASTSSFVLVMAPFVFVNAPHIFIEAILVTLAITTSSIFIRENPGIGKRNMYALLAIYVVLKVMNLMVEVTFFGRILWAFSIVGLLPMYGIFRNMEKSTIRFKTMSRVIIALSALLYLAGWILSITGHYPLGRILLLAGLDQLFLAIILYVAIYSFIDFVGLLADIYNSTNRITMVKVDLIYNKLLNLVRGLAIVFWFWTLILNINADEFIRDHMFNLLQQEITIGKYHLSPGSILIFFLILYLSFYLSGMLDGLFSDEKRTDESSGKTSLGSIVLLLRLFVLSTGFVVGMIVAGIPLDSVGLFFGALGVGIGFGLQGLISNLISGIIIAFEKPVYVGDIIQVDGQKGRVTDIGLRATKVDTGDGAEYIIPNGSLINQTMTNWTLTSKHFKVETIVLVDIRNDANKVISLLEERVRQVPGILNMPPPAVRLGEITPTALHLNISCWVSDIMKAGTVQNHLLQQIHQTLDQAGISYPRKKTPGDAD